MTGKIGVQTDDGIATLEGEGDVEVINNQGYQVRELVKRDATPEQLEFRC